MCRCIVKSLPVKMASWLLCCKHLRMNLFSLTSFIKIIPTLSINLEGLVVHKVTIHTLTLPHLKCITLVSLLSSLPCISIGVRIELTINIASERKRFLKII